ANLQDKFKQRAALEDAYSNFVEPYVNQVMEIHLNSFLETPPVPVMFAGLGCVSGCLLLTVVYCGCADGHECSDDLPHHFR
ncbi:hypothetical protein, partial [Limnospira platensis]